MTLAMLGLALACYLLAAATFSAGVLLRHPHGTTIGRIATVIGAGAHFVAIGLRCAALHRAPFATPSESLGLLAWLLVLLYLGAERLWKLAAAAPFALGLAFLLGVLAESLGDAKPAAHRSLLAEPVVSLHLLAILTAFGAFALAFCCAGLYLLERRLLKSKHGLTWIKRLPPLLTTERAAFALTAIGFPLLTIGVLSGLLRAATGGLPTGWLTDPRILLTFAVWAVYATYLSTHLKASWPPTRTALVLLIGLPLCLLAFLVPSVAHRFTG